MIASTIAIGLNGRRAAAWVIVATCLACSCLYAHHARRHGFVEHGIPPRFQDMYPMWEATRAVLQNRNPYSDSVTRETQVQVYGRPLGSEQLDPMRFAYPLPAVLLFGPIAALSYSGSCMAVLLISVALSVLSVIWWSSPLSRVPRFPVILLMISSFPFMVCFLLAQPTLVYAALIAASIFCFRRGRHLPAGILMALACSKPQLAAIALGPVFYLFVSSWRKNRVAAGAFVATGSLLLLAAFRMQPDWVGGWLSVLHDYTNYTRSSLLMIFFGTGWGRAMTVAAIGAVLYVSKRCAESDLMGAVSFSISLLLFAIPFQPYNDILLLAPAVYLLELAMEPGRRIQPVSLVCYSVFLFSACGAIILALGLQQLFTLTKLMPLMHWDVARVVLTFCCFARPAAVLIATTLCLLRPSPAFAVQTPVGGRLA